MSCVKAVTSYMNSHRVLSLIAVTMTADKTLDRWLNAGPASQIVGQYCPIEHVQSVILGPVCAVQ